MGEDGTNCSWSSAQAHSHVRHSVPARYRDHPGPEPRAGTRPPFRRRKRGGAATTVEDAGREADAGRRAVRRTPASEL